MHPKHQTNTLYSTTHSSPPQTEHPSVPNTHARVQRMNTHSSTSTSYPNYPSAHYTRSIEQHINPRSSQSCATYPSVHYTKNTHSSMCHAIQMLVTPTSYTLSILVIIHTKHTPNTPYYRQHHAYTLCHLTHAPVRNAHTVHTLEQHNHNTHHAHSNLRVDWPHLLLTDVLTVQFAQKGVGQMTLFLGIVILAIVIFVNSNQQIVKVVIIIISK